MRKLSAVLVVFGILSAFFIASSFFIDLGPIKMAFSNKKINRTTASLVSKNQDLQCRAKFFRLNNKDPEVSEVTSFKWEKSSTTGLLEVRGHVETQLKDHDIAFVAIFRKKAKKHEQNQVFMDAYLLEADGSALSWISAKSSQVASHDKPMGFTQISTNLNNVKIPGRILANSDSPLYVTEYSAQKKGWIKENTLVYATLECRLPN